MRPDSITAESSGVSAAASVTAGWGRAAALLGLVVAVTIAAFHETAWSIVSIWIRSETFAHGFLIVPISFWLIWQKRGTLPLVTPQPAYLPLVLMIPVGFVWLLAHVVDVLVVQQLAFVALLVLGIWAVIGTPAARLLAFPLAFLFFAVPVGEELIYPLMNFTADFTVGMLRLTGIPVYRDGTFFSIPSGDWSVVEGCSGVRYLIASVTLGVLYAYLTYTRLWKRILFILVSIGVPVIANGLRAYIIVMIAHLSGNKLAHGIDHFIYGWVFFGIVVTIMFIVGAFWRDEPQEPSVPAAPSKGITTTAALGVTLGALALIGLWPALAWALADPAPQPVVLQAPKPVGEWRLQTEAPWDWHPRVVGTDGETYDFYSRGSGPVALYVGVYKPQRQGSEAVNFDNQMIRQKHPVWSNKKITDRSIRLGGSDQEVIQGRLESVRGEHILVWHWFRIGDSYTASPYKAKLLEVWSKLFRGRSDGALVAVAAPYTDKPDQAAAPMQAFIDDMLPSISAAIDRSVGEEQ